MPPEPSKENSLAFTHRLAAEVDRVISNSEEIRAEQNIHEQLTSALRARGINYVVSAGNDGEDVREFPEFFNERFDDHLLASRNAVIVGAIDTRGTADFSDDRVADFSSDYEQVAYLADGVDVPVQSNGQTIQVSGTSFSAPFVAGKLAAISLQHPEYSAPQTLAVLDESAFSPVAGSTLPVIR